MRVIIFLDLEVRVFIIRNDNIGIPLRKLCKLLTTIEINGKLILLEQNERRNVKMAKIFKEVNFE